MSVVAAEGNPFGALSLDAAGRRPPDRAARRTVGGGASVVAVAGRMLAASADAARFFGPTEAVDAKPPRVRLKLPRVRSIPARLRLGVDCGGKCDVSVRKVRVCDRRKLVEGIRENVNVCGFSPAKAGVVRVRTITPTPDGSVVTLALTRPQRTALVAPRRAPRARQSCFDVRLRATDEAGNRYETPLFDPLRVCFPRP